MPNEPNPSAISFSTPVTALPHIGPARAAEFARLGVATVRDLLEYFPRRYQFEASERPIQELSEGQIQHARGEIVAVDYIAARPRSRFEATINDGTGNLALVWFNGSYLRRQLHPGKIIRVKGKVGMFRGIPQMVNPKFSLVDENTPTIDDSRFYPIYDQSAKLKSDTIRLTIEGQLDAMTKLVEEWFEDPLLKKRGMMSRSEAYRLIHKPKTMREATQARRRLVYDELMLLQIGLGLSRKLRDGRLSAPVLRLDRTLDERICARFPFKMTGAQQNAAWQIAADLKKGVPMNRLLQGDVGSGKTIVALYAMLMAVANKLQSAMLAPTEVLAEQHFLTISNLLAGSSVRIERFTGKSKKQDKDKLLRALSNGEIHIAIGTQALIQKDIEFANLGLIVIDEQHKLGVEQRGQLRDKGYAPHYLVMTATPIPRTLALSYFADFDVTTLNELPPGRQPIVTRWARYPQIDAVYATVRKQIAAGRQAYVVVPQIDDSDVDETAGIQAKYDVLTNGPLAGIKIAMLHGRMNTEERGQVMQAFRRGEIDVLLATTVIEVGIDVPNANVIVIESAERFGLSQLHQLRGRVGRGKDASLCILLSDATTEDATARLEVMTKTNSGFEIAETDLQLRGPGQFFGTQQHGLPELKLADVGKEIELLHVAKDDAIELLKEDPDLRRPVHKALRQAIIHRFGDSIPLAQIG